jgi:hypothetical protein
VVSQRLTLFVAYLFLPGTTSDFRILILRVWPIKPAIVMKSAQRSF